LVWDTASGSTKLKIYARNLEGHGALGLSPGYASQDLEHRTVSQTCTEKVSSKQDHPIFFKSQHFCSAGTVTIIILTANFSRGLTNDLHLSLWTGALYSA